MWPGDRTRQKKKRGITSYCEGSPSSNSISESNPPRIERHSFYNIFCPVCSFFLLLEQTSPNIRIAYTYIHIIVYGRVSFPQDRVINLGFGRHLYWLEVFSMLTKKYLVFAQPWKRACQLYGEKKTQRIPYYFHAACEFISIDRTQRLELKYLFCKYCILQVTMGLRNKYYMLRILI